MMLWYAAPLVAIVTGTTHDLFLHCTNNREKLIICSQLLTFKVEATIQRASVVHF